MSRIDRQIAAHMRHLRRLRKHDGFPPISDQAAEQRRRLPDAHGVPGERDGLHLEPYASYRVPRKYLP